MSTLNMAKKEDGQNITVWRQNLFPKYRWKAEILYTALIEYNLF